MGVSFAPAKRAAVWPRPRREPGRWPARCPLPLAALQRDRPAEVPPLIKGYLRAGAWICGEPAWDPDFNTADLPILMPMAKVSGRYAKHYLGQEA